MTPTPHPNCHITLYYFQVSTEKLIKKKIFQQKNKKIENPNWTQEFLSLTFRPWKSSTLQFSTDLTYPVGMKKKDLNLNPKLHQNRHTKENKGRERKTTFEEREKTGEGLFCSTTNPSFFLTISKICPYCHLFLKSHCSDFNNRIGGCGCRGKSPLQSPSS